MGRPRIVCTEAVCQRRAEAERKARRRRRLAGIPEATGWYRDTMTSRYPRGGRDRLVRRMSREIAARVFRHIQPTESELLALEAAIMAGASPYTFRVSDLPLSALDRDSRRVLSRMQMRNREADPEYEAKRERRRASRGRWKRLWEALSDPKRQGRGNVFGQLLGQLPEDRRQSVYRALARALHPDVGGDADLMKLLNAAYESFPAPSPDISSPDDEDTEAAEAEAMELLLHASASTATDPNTAD